MTVHKLLKNKYFLILTFFVLWIVFFDEVNVILWLKQRAVNKRVEKKTELYKKNTQELEKQIKAFETSKDSVEKYAREHYCMKFDDEDVYVFD